MKMMIALLLILPVLPLQSLAAQVQEQTAGTGSDILSTVIAVAVGILLAKKLVSGKKL